MIKLDNNVIDFKKFNDGTIRVFIPIPESKRVTVTWLYDNCEEHLQIFYLISHLKASKCYVKLIMPYCPEARQDRVKTETDVFTLKYFCNLLNSLNIDEIEIFDIHSPVTSALLNNVKVITPKEILHNLITNILPRDYLIAYPDSGSEHRYSAMLRIPYIVGVKERDFETGLVRSLEILGARHMISGHSFLMIDDIMSRGSTIYLASKQLKDMGAKEISVYCSHCEDTVLGPHIGGQSLLDIPDLITTVYTTNSIFRSKHPKVKIIKEF